MIFLTASSVKLIYSQLQWQMSCEEKHTVQVNHNLIFPVTQCLIPPVSSLVSTTDAQTTRLSSIP